MKKDDDRLAGAPAAGASRAWMRRVRSVLFWVGCFTLPIAILCAVTAWSGVYPFGSESFLTEDLKYQYFDFFMWFRRVLMGEANIFYSFAQGMGSGTWGLYSYYLASPFNIIVLAFDDGHLTLAIFVIVAVKLGFVQLSATWYLRRRFSLGRGWSLVLALGYTWSTWIATDLRNPLWLDALILLPLAAWCCWRLIRTKTWMPLALVVAAEVIVCWYTAYISLLFLVVFILLELVIYVREGNRVRAGWVIGRALRFVGALAAGLALAAWIFLPTVLAMLGSPSTHDAVSLFRCEPGGLIRGFFPGSWTTRNVPQFYAGAVPLLGALAFLLNRRVDRLTRTIVFIFACFMVASSVLGPLEFVWCGLRVPNGFYSRTAFLFTFLEIWAAGAGLSAGSPHRASGGWLRARLQLPRVRRAAMALLLLVTCAELTWNAQTIARQLYVGYPQHNHDAYVSEAAAQIAALRKRDHRTFYRVDKTYSRVGVAFNEGYSQRFDQLSSYSSTADMSAIAFLNQMGYSAPGEFSTIFAAPNLVMDALLGVRYVSTTGVPAGYVSTGLPPVGGGAAFAQNPYALSLGYSAAPDVVNSPLPGGENPFERQNALLTAITGDSAPIFRKIGARAIEQSDDTMVWSVEVPAHAIGCVYVQTGSDADRLQPIGIRIDNGAALSEGWRFSRNVRALGSASDTPTSHEVALLSSLDASASPERHLPSGTSCIFYALDMNVFSRAIERLSAHQFEPTAFTDGYVAGTFRSARAGALLLSVPFDAGWEARVNGHAAKISPAFGGGMSVLKTDAGDSDIELSYRPPGLPLGCAISAGAAALLCLGCVLRFRRRSR